MRDEFERASAKLAAARQKLDVETLDVQRLRAEDELLDYRLGALTKGGDGKLAALTREKDRLDQIRDQNQQELARVLEDKDPAKAVARVEKATVVIITDVGFGSGFLTSADGTVITNYHVIQGSSKLTVKIQKQASREQVEMPDPRVLAIDVANDLVYLKLPPAPAEVAEDGLYPYLRVRREAVRSGEDVFAVGSPGAGNMVLDYTVTKGIISNPKRDMDGQPTIQTSCPVNPGNSGGPLCDNRGTVVGVVVAKGRQVEAVTFAIPVPQVVNILEHSGQDPYAVPEGGLAAWERKHDPLAQMRREAQTTLAQNAIPLPGMATSLNLSPDGRSLLIVMRFEGLIQELDLTTRKLGRSYRVPGQIAACAVQGMHIILSDATNKELHRLNRSTFALVDKTRSVIPIQSLVPVGDEYLLALSADADEPIVFTRNSWNRGPEQQIPLAGLGSFAGLDADRRTLALATPAGMHACNISLITMPNALQTYLALHTYSLRPDANPHIVDSMEQRFKSLIRNHAVTFEPDPGALLCPSVSVCPPDRLICGRLCIRLGTTPRAEGVFESSPYTRSEHPAFKNRRPLFMVMDSIFSVSPNGKSAASGTCIYDVDTRKVVKLLPLITPGHAFSQDGRHIYFSGFLSPTLYILENWRETAPDPAGRF